MRPIRTRWVAWFVGLSMVAAIVWTFAPRPETVEVTRVSRGRLIVTIDEEARTRVRDRYTVSAPVAGYLTRMAYRPGAVVRAGQTVASVLPVLPAPIDARSRSQLEARVDGAVDALSQARTRVASARAALERADRDLERQRRLERERVIAPQEMDDARMRQQVADADVKAAVAGVDVAEHEVQAARAALFVANGKPATGRRIDVRAPRDGAILRVFEESARVVAAGIPLVEIGAPSALEIIADLLSTDAVQVSPGTRVLVDRWGGEGVLNGRVRLVEPSSFTKTSALGVEEQRVNVLIDFTDPPAVWDRLGDGFALEVHIVIWERNDVLKLPAGALSRRGEEWCVFKVVRNRAIEHSIQIGRRNGLEAEIATGLAEGDLVVVHPSERISDGVRIAIR